MTSTFGIFLADRYRLMSSSSVIIKTLLKENSFKNTEINKIYDVSGKILNSTQINQHLIYIYDDGTVEKRIVIE